MKAIWNNQIIAESDQTVIVEGNHYFPETSIKKEFLTESKTHSVCPWKGTASCYNISIAGDNNNDAAWYYPETKDAANSIKGYVAFWRGVEVTE